MVASATRQIKDFLEERFNDWLRILDSSLPKTTEQVENKFSSSILQFDAKSGRLVVLIDENIPQYHNDCKWFELIGLKIPKGIHQRLLKTAPWMQHLIGMKQVANFYNTIDKQILDCHKPMLVNLAIELEAQVKETGLKGNQTNIDAQLQQLLKSCDKLVHANEFLKNKHAQIQGIVEELGSTDLYNEKPKWKVLINEMKTIINTVVDEMSIKMQDTIAWRKHWDTLLYQQLKKQYSKCLETFTEIGPKLNTELTMTRSSQLQLKPSIANLTQKLEDAIEGFIRIPSAFKGMNSGSDFFKSITSESINEINNCKSSIQVMWQQLQEFVDNQQVIELGVSLDKKTGGFLSPLDWEDTIKSLKLKANKIEEIQETHKISLITISMTQFKASMFFSLDVKNDELEGFILQDINNEQAFINNCIGEWNEKFSLKFDSVAAIQKAQVQLDEFSPVKSVIESSIDSIQQKEKLLINPIKRVNIGLKSTLNDWNQLCSLTNGFPLLLQEQLAELRLNVESRIAAVTGEIDQVLYNWKQIKMQSTESLDSAVLQQYLLSSNQFKNETLALLQEKWRNLQTECRFFSIEIHETSDQDVIIKDLNQQLLLEEESVMFALDFLEFHHRFSSKSILNMRSVIGEFINGIEQWNKRLKTTFKSHWMYSWVNHQAGLLFACIPGFKLLKGESWIKDHWLQLFSLLQITIQHGASLVLEMEFSILLSKLDIFKQKTREIKRIDEQANAELAIRQVIDKLDIWASTLTFEFKAVNFMPLETNANQEFAGLNSDQESNKKSNQEKGQEYMNNEIGLIKNFQNLFLSLGEHSGLVQAVADSRQVYFLQEKLESWNTKITLIDRFLNEISQIQRQWAYLEPVFRTVDLPRQKRQFQSINSTFISLYQQIHRDNRVFSLFNIADISAILSLLATQLKTCQTELSETLEQKRRKFPRFYFISDEDLIQIIGQGQSPSIVQSHLKKLFAGVNSVVFDSEFSSVIGFRSIQHETVLLKNPVLLSHCVEDWIHQFTVSMEETLKVLLIEYLKHDTNHDQQQIPGLMGITKADADLNQHGIPQSQAPDDIKAVQYPAQIICLGEAIKFTMNCENAIQSRGLPQLLLDLQSKLNLIIKSNTLTSTSLALDYASYIDTTTSLIKNNCHSIHDWSWEKKLRFYLINEKVVAKMAKSSIECSFEYQGNPEKLVQTSLTERCFMVLFDALKKGLGGNPYGPAGTGKTETVKALASLLGRQCIVFNCDESMDAKSMRRILTGIVKCGAWGCFDEFNRLEIGVLSEISSTIQDIQLSMRENHYSITVDGVQCSVDCKTGIFVTLNPAGKRYGGRTRLPGNLKKLFRSIAMTLPDIYQIAQVSLMTIGFQNSHKLASKLCFLNSMCCVMFNKEKYHEWGLRMVKACLRGITSSISESITSASITSETDRLVESLRSAICTRLNSDELELFNQFVKQTFSLSASPTEKSVDLRGFVEENQDSLISTATIVSKQGLQSTKPSIKSTKPIYIRELANDLWKLCQQRMGVIVTGPPASGKSSVWRELIDTLEKQKQVRSLVISPKGMDKNLFLGFIDKDTREWNDGVVSYQTRLATQSDTDELFIVFDGSVDPEWIEAFNSVLDDNRLLTLPNGERVKFGKNVHFIFETCDLEHASPATLSRLGVLLVDPTNSCILNESIRKIVDWTSQTPDALLVPLNNFELGLMSERSAVFNDDLQTLVNIFFLFISVKMSSKMRFEFKNFLEKSFKITPSTRSVSKDKLITLQNSTISSFETAQACTQTLHVDCIVQFINLNQNLILYHSKGYIFDDLLVDLQAELTSKYEFEVFECNADSKAVHLQRFLSVFCSKVETRDGSTLVPKKSKELIVVVKNFDVLKKDAYGHINLLEMLHGLIKSGGLWTSPSEYVKLLNVHFILTSQKIPVKPSRLEQSLPCIVAESSSIEEQSLKFRQIIETSCPIIRSEPPQLRNSLVEILIGSLEPNQNNLKTLLHSISISSGGVSSASDLADLLQCNIQRARGLPTADYSKLSVTNQLYLSFNQTFSLVVKFDEYSSLLKESYFDWKSINQVDKSQIFTFAVTEFCAMIEMLVASMYCSQHHNVTDNNDVIGGATRDNSNNNYYQTKQSNPKYHQTHQSDANNQDNLEYSIQINTNMIAAGNSGDFRRNCVEFMAFRLNVQLMTYNSSTKIDKWMKSLFDTALNGSKILICVEDSLDANIACIYTLFNCLFGFGLNELVEKSEFKAFKMSAAQLKLVIKTSVKLVILCSCTALQNILQKMPCIADSSLLFNLSNHSQSSLEMIARDTFETLNFSLESYSNIPSKLAQVHLDHTSKTVGNEKQFKAVCQTFVTLYNENMTEFSSKNEFLSKGIRLLDTAYQQASALTDRIKSEEIEIKEKQELANQSLTLITVNVEESAQKRLQMEILNKELNENKSLVAAQKQSIETQLKEAEPVLVEAQLAVKNIKPESLTEIRSLRSPPTAIKDVIEAVLMLMGIQDTSWNSMKTFLGQRTIKDQLVVFDARNISVNLRKNVQLFIDAHSDSFDPVSIKRVSAAASPLAAWVKANLFYASVSEKIEPLSKEFAGLNETLKGMELQIQQFTLEMQIANAQIEQGKQEFSKQTCQVEILKAAHSSAVAQLSTLQKLLESLGSEYGRWKVNLEQNSIRESSLVNDCFAAACMIYYTGFMSIDDRCQFANQFGLTSAIEDFLSKCDKSVLFDKGQVPRDDQLAIQNLMYCVQSLPWQVPLVVDHVNTSWMASAFECVLNHKVQIVDATDERSLERTLAIASKLGNCLLIKLINRIPACLEAYLLQENRDFQIILHCQAINPNDRLLSLVNQVHFDYTEETLSNEILGIAMNHYHPDLEQEFKQKLHEQEQLERELKAIEQQILKELCKQDTVDLMDPSLSEFLGKSQEKSTQVELILVEFKRQQAEIQAIRNDFKLKWAARLASLFFELELTGAAYVSVGQFCRVFKETLVQSSVDSIFLNLFHFLSLQLGDNQVNRHLIALILLLSIQPDGRHGPSIIALLGNRKIFIDSKSQQVQKHCPIPREIPFELETEYLILNYLDPQLVANMSKVAGFWKFVKEDCNKCNGLFAKQGLRDKILEFINKLSQDHLCSQSHLPQSYIDQLFKYSVEVEPILVFGGDCNSLKDELQLHLKQSDSQASLVEVGSSQENLDEIKILIANAAQNGNWILLHNVHILHTCQLQNICNLSAPLPSFKLIMTTERLLDDAFMKKCLNATVSNSNNFKDRLVKYKTLVNDDRLAMIHTVLTERCKIVPQGFTKNYEWNDLDLVYAEELVSSYKIQSTNDNSKDNSKDNALKQDFMKPFTTNITNNDSFMGKILSEMVYASRIENNVDKRLLETIIHAEFNESDENVLKLPRNIQQIISNQIVEEWYNATRKTFNSAEFKDLSNVSQNFKIQKKWRQEVRPLFAELLKTNLQLIQKMHHKSGFKYFLQREYESACQLYQLIDQDLFNAEAIVVTSSVICRWNELHFIPVSTAEEYLSIALAKTKAFKDLFKDIYNAKLMFNPVVFLYSLLCDTNTQQADCPIEEYKLVGLKNSSIKIENILVQGSRFDGSSFTQNNSEDPSFSYLKLPFKWTHASQIQDTVSVPLYENLSRENLVCNVELKHKSENELILSNVGLFLQE